MVFQELKAVLLYKRKEIARLPVELVFLDKFCESQMLSVEKLRRSSYVGDEPGATIFTELPELIQYYFYRWEHST